MLNFLVAELLKESGLVPLPVQDNLPSQGLYDSFEAAAILAQALREKQELTENWECEGERKPLNLLMGISETLTA